MRRATRNRHCYWRSLFISIHALHEESDCGDLLPCVTLAEISIHALHEESDRMIRTIRLIPPISIHALHEESDQSSIFPVVRVG